MIDATALQKALQAKFGPPGRTSSRRRILKQLGLDEDLLGAPTASGGGDKAKAMRIDIENALGELYLDERQVAKLLAIMDKFAPWDRLDDNDPNAERAREIAGDDTTEADLKKLRAFLMAGGLSEADADEALSIVKSPRALDTGLPRNALAGGYGGKLAQDAASALDAIRGTGTEAQAIRRDDLGVLGDALERLSKRRTVSPGVIDRLAMDSAADAALRQAQKVERFHDDFERKHPEVARVF
jgi:hypothetical protein